MRVNQCIDCKDFPCRDVRHECYVVPDVEVQTGPSFFIEKSKRQMIAEDIAAALRLIA